MTTQTPSPCPTLPPHCPNPKCRGFQPGNPLWKYQRFGTFSRIKPPYTVQRYRCNWCKRIFSDQTFKSTYWLKCPELLPEVLLNAVSGAATRQIARILGCARTTVDNHLARLGRHCVLFHRQMVEQAPPFVDIVFDGLVTFEWSQFHPYEILVSVDRNSSFVIHFAEAERRRSGTMTDDQREKREKLEAAHGRADPKSVMKAAVEVLTESLKNTTSARVWTDLHKTYPFALRKLKWCDIDHRTVDSRVPRTTWNPLYEVNLADMLVRHCMKDHTRETIAFGKRRQHSIYRFAIFAVWRNFIKLRRERRCEVTPAMLLGLADRQLREEDILVKRLFVQQTDLTPMWADYYWRRIETRPLAVNRRHELRYAM